MNTHTVRRHIKPQPRVNTSQLSRPSLLLPPPTNFGHGSLLHLFLKPPASAGGASGSSTLKASPKGEDCLPFPEGDIKQSGPLWNFNLSGAGATGMKLREHPLMICGGIRNWPPLWVWVGGEKNERPRGEVGVLIRVEPSVIEFKRLFLTIQYNDSEYMGWLSFDDAAFCREIYNLLKGFYRHSISETGELNISRALE